MTRRTALALASLLFSPLPDAVAQARKIADLDTKHLLGGSQACAVAGSSVHLLSSNKLLFLAGPDPSCYRSVMQLELVVMGTDGKVIARKPWHSTYPVVVLSEDRIATSTPESVTVYDQHLQSIQTYPLPPDMEHTSTSLSGFNGDTVIVHSPRGETLALSGNPLAIDQAASPPPAKASTPVLIAKDGTTYAYSGKELLSIRPDGTQSAIASLSWVHPCGRFCQEYEAGLGYSLAVGPNPRILFVSNGSRFPITDAAGLFPYFRIQVFDLKTGKELYRKEFVTKTALRSATISPDGALLAVSDPSQITVEQLP